MNYNSKQFCKAELTYAKGKSTSWVAFTPGPLSSSHTPLHPPTLITYNSPHNVPRGG